MNIVVRGIREDDIKRLCGKSPVYSVMGRTIELDGEPVCIAGVSFEGDKILAFSDIAPNIKAPKRTIWRYAKQLADYIASLGYPVIAKTENSGKFLRSLGFKQQGKDYIL